MKKIILSVVFCFIINLIFGQHPIGDKLEQLYSQGHYGIVYRKSGKFLIKDDTKNLLATRYYRAISTLQKVNNYYWFKKNLVAANQAFETLNELKKDSQGKQFLEAHAYELYELKNDLSNWLTELNQTKLKHLVSEYATAIDILYKNVDLKFYDSKIESKIELNTDYSGLANYRIDLIQFAKKYLGVPYVWGGESPEGFDCSGFTQYILKSKGIIVPRTAGDQYNKSLKIGLSEVQAGDLVFFKNDTKISHVGMIISKKGEPLKMIHASSSLGISIIEIHNSEYWKKRLFAYGTFLN